MTAARLSPAFAALGLLLALSGAEAKSLHRDYKLLRGEVQLYGDWLVGCDNRADCTMIGFPPEQVRRELDVGLHEMAIQISLSGPADAIPLVELVPFAMDADRTAGADAPGPFVLNVEYDVAAISPPHGFSRHPLLPMEAIALIKHLGHDRRLEGRALSGNRVIVRFPQAEFQRAFRAMQSRRAQLLKELPDGSTMPAPSLPQRLVATELMVSGFSPIFANRRCTSSIMMDLRHYRFTGGAELWSYHCDDGTGQRRYWQMASNAIDIATPLDLPEPRDGRIAAGDMGLENAVFERDFGILRSYQYLDGQEDCGTFRAWGFTESGWQLLERREMPLCKGLDPSGWIRTHYTPTDGPGPDE